MSTTTEPDTSGDQVLFHAKVNGQERPVTLAQAKRYAEQIGGMQDQARVVTEAAQELEQWRQFKAGYQRDPHGTLAELASAAGGAYDPTGSSDSDSEDDDEGSDPVNGRIQQLEAELRDLKSGFQSYTVNDSVQKEIDAVKRANPDMTEQDLTKVMARAANYGGLPLAEAWKLEQFEKLQADKGSGETAKPAVEPGAGLPISHGSGTPETRVAKPNEGLDFTKPLKDLLPDAWEVVKAKTGLTD